MEHVWAKIKSWVNTQLAGKANSSHTHTYSQITDIGSWKTTNFGTGTYYNRGSINLQNSSRINIDSSSRLHINDNSYLGIDGYGIGMFTIFNGFECGLTVVCFSSAGFNIANNSGSQVRVCLVDLQELTSDTQLIANSESHSYFVDKNKPYLISWAYAEA